MKESTKRLKHGRTAGIDNFMGEFLRFCGKKVDEMLAYYLNYHAHKTNCAILFTLILVAINKPR